jgi:FkbM family methyltransferase
MPHVEHARALTIDTRYGPLQIPAGEPDIIGRFLTRYGEWGWNEACFVASVLQDGARVLDAGAFVGTFGLGLALLRPLKTLCCVEANHAIVPFLTQNLAANAPCPAVVVEAMLAGPGEEPRAGRAEPGNLGATSFCDADDTAAAIPPPRRAISLAELRAEYGEADFIKLDVEGMELAILQGDAAHLSRGGTTLWIECNEDPRSLEVVALLLSWNLDVFYFAWPAYNPGNVNAYKQAVYPFAFEAGLLVAPRIPPVLGPELRAQSCLLTQVRSIEDVRLALWRTPRWGMAEWETAASMPELAALAGRSLRGESFAAFLQPGTPAPKPLAERLAAAEIALARVERELARVAARALDHLAALGASRDHAAGLERALAVMRASNSWRITAPLRKGRTSFLKKRSKKLLQMGAYPDRPARLQRFKSFLVLFFKKEHSS